jgi:hypothetical protein
MKTKSSLFSRNVSAIEVSKASGFLLVLLALLLAVLGPHAVVSAAGSITGPFEAEEASFSPAAILEAIPQPEVAESFVAAARFGPAAILEAIPQPEVIESFVAAATFSPAVIPEAVSALRPDYSRLSLTAVRRYAASEAGNADSFVAAEGFSPAAMNKHEEADLTWAGSFGGDDDYDPAAGATPEMSVIAVATDASSLVACVLSADEMDEMAGQSALTVAGGLSGDDDYDPAAGGMPEMSLIACGTLAQGG